MDFLFNWMIRLYNVRVHIYIYVLYVTISAKKTVFWPKVFNKRIFREVSNSEAILKIFKFRAELQSPECYKSFDTHIGKCMFTGF